jgi:16S rRNA (guanine(966)-N(2))-methyltransferase RsmD
LKPRSAHSLSASGEVRLIGGQWKRSKLPVADRPGLRPTPDRVRETLFNWLGQDLCGWHVLDAFAGSGALGFEAASRGAGPVVLIESDAGLARSLGDSARRLKATELQVVQADALQWMNRAAARASPPGFDLIFLDPPFERGLFEPAWQHALPLLKPGGWLYLEAPAQSGLQAPGLHLHRHLKAGAVHAHLWKSSPQP